MKQATNKKNTARLTAALFALILLFPCCMDSGSGGSSDYDSGSNTENNGSQENPDEPDAPENPDEIYSADVESSVVANLDGTCTVYVENELAGENISTSEIKELIRGRAELCVADKMSGYGYITPSIVNLTVKYSVKDGKELSNTEYRTYVLPPLNAVIAIKDGFIYGAGVNLVQNLDAVSRSEQSGYVEVLISDDGKTTVEGVALESASVDPEAEYTLKPTGSKVNVIAFIAAKKNLAEKGVKNITCAYNSSTANFFLDFSNKSFANTTDEIESRSEYASKKGLTSSTSIITDENLTETIKIGDVEFITKPIYYKSDNDKVIQQAFKFGQNVDNVKVTFGKNHHSMTEAYKGGIILENSNAKITSDDVNSATLTGYVYTETMNGLSDNSLMSKLAKDSDFLPTLNFDFVSLSGNNNFYGTGVDKIFENYYNKSSRLQLTEDASNVFDAEKYLNGGYMYSEDGNYNNNAYDIDINIALLMAEKLTRKIENVNVSGSITSDKDTTLNPSNVRFSGDVSGLNFTATAGNGIIDFAGVGPKSEITAVDAKVIVRGLKEGSYEGIYTANTLDFYGVDKTLLENIEVGNATKRVYGASSSNFSLVNNRDTVFKTGSSASTNRAWEEAGRNRTLPSDSLSKLDVKTKADNPLLQKLLDENCPVYG